MTSLLKPDCPPRLKILRDSARHYQCVLCGKDARFTVAAHCNDLQLFPREFGWLVGKGIGDKAPHFMVAYVCGDYGGCHDKIDGRSGGLALEEKRALWNRAYARTVALWWLEGLIRVT